MRLWDYRLLGALPRKQLVSQWRECVLIAKNISEKGTPNHILVNKIMEYPIDEFYTYGYYVSEEMRKRGYKCNLQKWYDYMWKLKRNGEPYNLCVLTPIFREWHTERYLKQCIYNLQEKADCLGVSVEEWEKIEKFAVDRGISL